MTILVLLPGLDGTDRLSAPFVAAAGGGGACRVVAYPTDAAHGYPALLDYVRERLPAEPFVLVAESFSGPLGMCLAAEHPPRLKALVLVCTFATAPLPLPYALTRWLVPWLPVRRAPVRLLLRALGGEDPTPAARRAFAEIIAAIPDAVLHARLRAVLGVDVRDALARVRVPVLYLQGAQDRLIGPWHAARIRRWHPATRVQRLRGPHFLLQARPVEAAAAIRAFVRGATGAADPCPDPAPDSSPASAPPRLQR